MVSSDRPEFNHLAVCPVCARARQPLIVLVVYGAILVALLLGAIVALLVGVGVIVP